MRLLTHMLVPLFKCFVIVNLGSFLNYIYYIVFLHYSIDLVSYYSWYFASQSQLISLSLIFNELEKRILTESWIVLLRVNCTSIIHYYFMYYVSFSYVKEGSRDSLYKCHTLVDTLDVLIYL